MRAPTDHLPAEMPTSNRPLNDKTSMNDDASRLDGVAKVTGAAKYGRDMYVDRQLHVAFIRCPYGAADLVEADTDAAKALPGVLEVVLEGDEGRYHGHTIGYVVAESKTQMRRALHALATRWRRKPVTTTIDESASDPPAMDGATEQLLAGAEYVLEATYSTPVQTHSSLETHGGAIEHDGERAVAYISTQGTFAAMDGLDEALGLPRSKFEVRCEYVGGGFGSKLGGPGKEGALAARLAAKYRRPVYHFVNRAEEHLDTGNRPSSRTWVKVGFNRDGTILGGQIFTWGGVGIAGGGGGVRCPSGRYNLGEIQKGRNGHEDVQFNGGGPRAFRAPGHPQGAFAEELMLDEIATMAGVDPLDLRLKLDQDADRRDMYRQGAELIGWGDRQRTGSQKGTIRRGFGMGSATWGRFPSNAEAEVIVNRDGSIEVRTGTQDIGTGMRTVAGVVASEYLGVPLDRVHVAIGRSTLPPGPASGGSVTSHNTAPAIMAAAEDAKRKFLEAVASRLGENADGFDLLNGSVLHHNEPVMTFDEACQKLGQDSIIGKGQNDQETNRRHLGEGHSHGAQFADVEVDSETGVIHVKHIVAIQSCGRVVCRKTAESQIIGGVIQGISYALFENKILDRNTGAMVNPNLEWYKIAGPADTPHIEPVLFIKGQTGVRSLGEPPTIPTAGAIACAVYNAIGAPVRHLPLTADKVLTAVNESKGGAS